MPITEWNKLAYDVLGTLSKRGSHNAASNPTRPDQSRGTDEQVLERERVAGKDGAVERDRVPVIGRPRPRWKARWEEPRGA